MANMNFMRSGQRTLKSVLQSSKDLAKKEMLDDIQKRVEEKAQLEAEGQSLFKANDESIFKSQDLIRMEMLLRVHSSKSDSKQIRVTSLNLGWYPNHRQESPIDRRWPKIGADNYTRIKEAKRKVSIDLKESRKVQGCNIKQWISKSSQQAMKTKIQPPTSSKVHSVKSESESSVKIANESGYQTDLIKSPLEEKFNVEAKLEFPTLKGWQNHVETWIRHHSQSSQRSEKPSRFQPY